MDKKRVGCDCEKIYLFAKSGNSVRDRTLQLEVWIEIKEPTKDTQKRKSESRRRILKVGATCDLGEGSLIGMMGAGASRLKRKRNDECKFSFQKYTCAAKDPMMAGWGGNTGLKAEFRVMEATWACLLVKVEKTVGSGWRRDELIFLLLLH